MAVNIIDGGTPDKVYSNQQRSDKSTQRDILGEEGEDLALVPRFVYLKMGNWTNNKVLIDAMAEPENSEYQFFLTEMNRLFVEYKELPVVSDDLANIALIDQYLGKLGTIMEYPFKDDSYNSSPWIDIREPSLYRNVISRTLDVDGFETNVITSVNGVDTNVLHLT